MKTATPPPLRFAPNARIYLPTSTSSNADGDRAEFRGERPLIGAGQGREGWTPSLVDQGEPAGFWITAGIVAACVLVWAAVIALLLGHPFF